MEKDIKNPAAVALGSLGGQAKSKRKVAAARANANLRKANAARKNGQKGGWPKGKRRKGKRRAFTVAMG